MIQVGRYDTSPLTTSYNGSWGNCPYLSSGNILVSDSQQGLFVFTPNYVRACYLEGLVTDSETKTPLANVKVNIIDGGQIEPPLTSPRGEYRTGQVQAGEFEVLFYKDGYRPLIRKVRLEPGKVCLLDAELIPLASPGSDLAMLILSAEDNRPLANLDVVIRGDVLQLQTRTDAKGWARIPMIYKDTFDVFPAFWGLLPLKNIPIDPASPPVVRLGSGYYDDFHFDLGWISEGEAQEGFWERGVVPTDGLDFHLYSVKGDMPNDLGNKCYTTGLPTPDDDADVDGIVRLVSPAINMDNFRQPVLDFGYWFMKEWTSAQKLTVFLENETGKKEIWSSSQEAVKWTAVSGLVLSETPLKGTWKLVFEGIDTLHQWGCCVFEAGIDEVFIREGQPVPAAPEDAVRIDIYPNPFHDRLLVRYLMTDFDATARWRLFDVAGRQLLAGPIDSEAAELEFAPSLARGVYFFHVEQQKETRAILKLVKF
jgi:hypothetical protein